MREANDLKIGAAIRRELSSRRVDLTKLKFPVKAGEVTLQGELSFIGLGKTADEIAIELKFIESSIESIEGVSKTNFELTNWKKGDTGIWESAVSSICNSSSSSARNVVGDGFVCPDCDFVIRFCPCCGKPLTSGEKLGAHRSTFGSSFAKPSRKPLPPIKPIVKKHSIPVPIVPPLTPIVPTSSAVADNKNADKAVEPVVVPVKPTVPEVNSVKATGETKTTEKPSITSKLLKPLPPLKPLKPIDKPLSQASEQRSETEVPLQSKAQIMEQEKPLAENSFAKPQNQGFDTNFGNQGNTAIPNFMAETAESPVTTLEQPVGEEQTDVPPTLNLNMDFELGPVPNSRSTAVNPNFPAMSNLDLNLENIEVQSPAPSLAVEPMSNQPPIPNLGMGIGDLDNQPPMPDLGMGLGNLGNQPPMPDLGMGLGNLGNQPSMPDLGMGLGNLGNQPPIPNFGMPQAQEQPLAPNLGIELSMDISETSGQAAIPDLSLGLDMNLSAMPESGSIPNLGILASKSNSQGNASQTAPDFNFGNLDDLGLTASMEQDDTPLPPMKPAKPASISTKPNQSSQPPQAQGLSFDNLGDDDTPLPPMKPAQPAPKKAPAKKNNDIFASLFNDNDLGGTTGMDGSNLDLNLDVLEIFPNEDQGSIEPTIKSVPKSKAQPQQAPEADPFNLDNVLDLDSMMGTGNPAPAGKDETGTFNLDDFDISKFKL